MENAQKIFNVTREEDSFLLGRLEHEEMFGAYLPGEYLVRLGEVLEASKKRIDFPAASDAVKNLFGILDRLLSVHQEQVESEHKAGSDHSTDGWFQLTEEMNHLSEEVMRLGQGRRGKNDDPDDA